MGCSESKRVSAIVTAFNSEAYLAAAIRSIKNQTFPVSQIIIVDDASTDSTLSIAGAIPGVEIVAQKTNSGPGAARNEGLALARGELIAFLDADDRWLPHKTEKQVAYLEEHPDAVAVSGGKVWSNEETGETRSHPYPERSRKAVRTNLAFENCVGNPSMVLMRREAISAAGGFDATVSWGQDWELWIRLAAQGKIGFVPDDVIVYLWRTGNHSHTDPEARLRSFYAVSKEGIGLLLPAWRQPAAHLDAFSRHAGALADLTSKRGHRFAALGWATLAVVIWPFALAREKTVRILRLVMGETSFSRLKAIRRMVSFD